MEKNLISMSKMERLKIRKALRKDCKEIMRLVHELADFEKLPEYVNISHRDLERDGFETDHPLFGCYVVETQVDDNELGKDGVELGSVEENAADGDGDGRSRLVGYALYYQRYSTWNGVSLHLEDLYVSPRFRQQGVGRALFKQVAKECVALGCRQLDFEVLNWNPARKFYEKLGSVNRTENGGWHSYRLAGEALQRLGDGDS